MSKHRYLLIKRSVTGLVYKPLRRQPFRLVLPRGNWPWGLYNYLSWWWYRWSSLSPVRLGPGSWQCRKQGRITRGMLGRGWSPVQIYFNSNVNNVYSTLPVTGPWWRHPLKVRILSKCDLRKLSGFTPDFLTSSKALVAITRVVPMRCHCQSV